MNYLAIDIGGSFIKYALVDHSGNIKKVKKVHTPQDIGGFLKVIFEIISPLKNDIKRIGISLPGKIDTQNGIVYFGGALQFLHEFPLKEKIESNFNICTELSNDGKAAALAELWLGNLKDTKNGAAIILGTGVGGGIILNGELYQGSHFQAGELSFMINNRYLNNLDDMTGLSCSAVEFVKSGNKILQSLDLMDGEAVFEAIKLGENNKLIELFNNYCRLLANLIINLQAVLDIETVVIGGGISQQNILIENIINQYQNIRKKIGIFDFMLAKVDIKPCKFRNDANLLGSVYNLLLIHDQKVTAAKFKKENF